MNDKKIKILSEEKVTKAIFTMSIPVVLGMMIQVLYNLVDTFFIGKLQDANQLAAANITTPLFMIMMAIAGIVGTGASSYISRCLGEKKYNQANKIISTGIAICIGLGVLVTIIGIIVLPAIVRGLGASNITFSYAYNYSLILFIGSIFIMCNYAIGQLIRSEGAATTSMIGMFIGTVTNIILDPILIFGFKMGITGAAIATVLGNAIALGYYAVYYIKGKSVAKVNLKDITFDKEIWKQIFVIGIPATVSQLLMSFAMIICNNFAANYGENVVAGMGVATKIMTIGTFIFMGFAAGCQPLVGYNYGAKNTKRVVEIIKKGMIITTTIGLILLGIFVIFSKPLIATFTDLGDVIIQGNIIIRALMFSLPVVGAQMLATTTVQALGKGKASLFLSIARQGLIYIPLLLILNKIFKFNGLIYAQPIADILTLGLSIITLIIILKKDINSDKENEEQINDLLENAGEVI